MSLFRMNRVVSIRDFKPPSPSKYYSNTNIFSIKVNLIQIDNLSYILYQRHIIFEIYK